MTTFSDVERQLRLEMGEPPWWLLLIAGIAWIIFAFVVLSFDYKTVWSIAVFAGVMFLAMGITEFMIAAVAPGWRWLHALLGVASIAVGVISFAWPDVTFVALAALLAWYLVFAGVIHIVVSLMDRDIPGWWLTLLIGVAEVIVGFWAIGYPGRSFVLLAVWVAATALTRGIVDVFLAFRLKDASAAIAAPRP